MFTSFSGILVFVLLKYLKADYVSTCNYETYRNFPCKPELYWCSENECIKSYCGYNAEEAVTVRFGAACFIPERFFRNSPRLMHIYGSNIGIEMLGPQSFVNLPELKSIQLPFNHIRYIFQDTFIKVHVEFLDLSWNKLNYIEEGAFINLQGLKYVNFSHNELIQQPAFPETVKEIMLSHNFLTFALLSSKMIVADFSFNKLTSVGISTTSNMELLDISMNNLYESGSFSFITVKKFRISFNNFVEYPEYIQSPSEEISLYPNPWSCESLKETWKNFFQSKIKIVKPSLDKRFANINETFPICISYSGTGSEDDLNRQKYREAYITYTNQTQCVTDENCSDNEICRNLQCFNPCKEHVCHKSNICVIDKHKYTCTCPGIYIKNPFLEKSRCYLVECFVDSDCPLGKICNRRICE